MTRCPFHGLDYLRGLSHLGSPESHGRDSVPILRRPIPGTPYFDGVGPWPYGWVRSDDDLQYLQECFPHLVSLAVVTQPGWVPPARFDQIKFLKDHFVYDPGLPLPPLSARTRSRLRLAEQSGQFEIVHTREERMLFTCLYEDLKQSRNLHGSLFDMPASHFESLARHPDSIFFVVRNAAGIGAMACGVIFNGMLQLLHNANTENGRSWNAAYLLMRNLQLYAMDNQLLLLTGGMPSNGSEGLRIFKSRWSNCFFPVYLLSIVNRPRIYWQLASKRERVAPFFPAYRA